MQDSDALLKRGHAELSDLITQIAERAGMRPAVAEKALFGPNVGRFTVDELASALHMARGMLRLSPAAPPTANSHIDDQSYGPPEDWTPSPEVAALSDAEVMDVARDTIKSLAADIAPLVNMTAAATLHALCGWRGPIKQLNASQLSDVLDEGRFVLQSLRGGNLLQPTLAQLAASRADVRAFVRARQNRKAAR